MYENTFLAKKECVEEYQILAWSMEIVCFLFCSVVKPKIATKRGYFFVNHHPDR